MGVTPKKVAEIKAKQQAFLEAYRECGRRDIATAKIGLQHTHVRHWLRVDKEFRQEYLAAQDETIHLLEDEAFRRAYEGVSVPQFFKGQPILDPKTGLPLELREYSDEMLKFLMAAKCPIKYKSRPPEATPQVIEVVFTNGFQHCAPQTKMVDISPKALPEVIEIVK